MASARAIKAGSAFVEFFLDDGKLQRGLRVTEQKLRQFGSKLRNVGAGLLGGGLAALTTLAFPFAKLAEFDDAVRAVGAVTRATDSDLRSMEDVAKELGRTTSFTAVEVANLMTELGRAGFSPKQINTMTDAVLNLSRATGTEAAQSAGIMAATIRQFSLGAEDATRVANVLTLAANSTFNTVEGLGEALSYAGPVAADLGMSLEDTVAILGTLGNVGVQGSSAGNAIRRLATLSAAEAEKMQGVFGVAFKDAAGNARPIVDVLDDVSKATNDLPTAERASKFSEAFGLLGITAASAISKSASETKQLAENLKGVTTEAADAAAAMDAGPGGMLRRLGSAFEGFQLAVGKAIEKIVAGIGENGLTAVLGKMTKFVENNPQIVKGFLLIAGAAAVGGAALVAVGISMQIAAAAVGGIILAVKAVVGTIVALKAAMMGVFAIASALASPIAIVGALTAGLAGYFIYASGAVQTLADFLGGRLTTTFKTLVDLLASGNIAAAGNFAMESLKAVFQIGLAKIHGFWIRFRGEIAKTFLGLTATLENAWISFSGFFVDNFARAAAMVRSVFQETSNKLAEYIAAAIAKTTGQDVNEVLETLKEDQTRNNRDFGAEAEQQIAQRQTEREERQKKNREFAQQAQAEVDSETERQTQQSAAAVQSAKDRFDAAQSKADGILSDGQTSEDVVSDDPAKEIQKRIEEAFRNLSEEREAGVAAAIETNKAVDLRSGSGQDEVIRALTAGPLTENQLDAAIEKHTALMAEELKKQTRQNKEAPRLKVAKT